MLLFKLTSPLFQDSSRDCEADTNLLAERVSGRRRAKSAPAPTHKTAEDNLPLPVSQPVSPLDRSLTVSPLDRDYTPPFCRVQRFSGTPATSPDIKEEPDLPLDLNPFDRLEDMDGSAAIKVEPDLGLDQLDNLQNLISTCDFSSVLEVDQLNATPWKDEGSRWKQETLSPPCWKEETPDPSRWKEQIPEPRWKEATMVPPSWKKEVTGELPPPPFPAVSAPPSARRRCCPS